MGRDSRRSFTQTQQKQILAQQDSRCARCHKRLDPRATQFDHKKAWAEYILEMRQTSRELYGNFEYLVKPGLSCANMKTGEVGNLPKVNFAMA